MHIGSYKMQQNNSRILKKLITRLSKDSAPHLALLVFTLGIGCRRFRKFRFIPEAVLLFLMEEISFISNNDHHLTGITIESQSIVL